MRIIRATHSVGVEEREWEDGETGFSPDNRSSLFSTQIIKGLKRMKRHMRMTHVAVFMI